MNAPKNKKNTIAPEDLKSLGAERKHTAFVRSSRSGQAKDLQVFEWAPAKLPPRIRQLISAAVRVWEFKRGLRATCPRTRAYQS